MERGSIPLVCTKFLLTFDLTLATEEARDLWQVRVGAVMRLTT